MGCGKWNRLVAVLIAIIMASCGGSDGGPSDSGNQFVFTARGRLNLIIQPPNDPRQILITATLLDPQGLPFRNTQVTFTADFADATFIPGDDNEGAVTTDDNGQATITLIAGLTTGRMRVLAEAPAALNLATGITVELTEPGFVSFGDLGIIPVEVTFINPLIDPGISQVCPDTPLENPDTTFNAVGGTPPYRWDNSNKDLGRICPVGLPNINQTAQYTLTGPIPTDTTEALQDTVRLQDAEGTQAEATVTVIFADCQLNADGTTVNLPGLPGAEFEIDVSDGVPPFTVTETFPGSVETDDPEEVCDSSENCHIVFTLPKEPDDIIFANPDTILIRDARGCTASVALTVSVPSLNIVVTADPASVVGLTGGDVEIVASVFDPSSQPIVGATVLFSTTQGTLTPITVETDAEGLARTTLTIPPGTPAGSVTVTAEALGNTGMVTIEVGALTISVTANPASVDAGDPSTITAFVTDEGGTPIDEVTVLFSTTHGGLNQNTRETGENGQAVVDLDTTGVPAGTSITVTGTAGGQEDSVTVTVNP